MYLLLSLQYRLRLIYQFYKVGDAGPILDAMAMMLENISAVTDVARTTIAAVFRSAQIIASIPNLSYQNKATSQ